MIRFDVKKFVPDSFFKRDSHWMNVGEKTRVRAAYHGPCVQLTSDHPETMGSQMLVVHHRDYADLAKLFSVLAKEVKPDAVFRK